MVRNKKEYIKKREESNWDNITIELRRGNFNKEGFSMK